MRQLQEFSTNWKDATLGDCVSSMKSGLSRLLSEADIGIPMLRSCNIGTKYPIFENLKYWYRDDPQGAKTSSYILKDGDILVNFINSISQIGKACLFKNEISRDCIYTTNILRLTSNKKVLGEFLFIITQTDRYNWYVSTITKPAVNQASFTTKDLKKYSFPLPPLPEQKAIADLLSTWDEAIAKTERLIKAKERRLDVYAKDLFDRKNDGKYEGWKVVKLKTVLNEHGDTSTGIEEVYSVSVHKGLVNQIEHLGRSFSAANTDNYNCVHYGDIVYTKSPTGDFPLGIVKQSYAKNDVIVSPLYGVFTPLTFNLGIVFDLYFSSPARARNYLSQIVQKGAKNTIAITNKTFLSKTLHLPLDERAQKNIAEFVFAAREEIELLKQLAEKYKIQKRGLMQKMLTGAWRVKPGIVNQYMEK